MQACGGPGGSGWRFLPRGNGDITDIIIRSGDAVDSISFVAHDRGRNRTYSSDNFGGDGGTEHKIKLDWPREYLTSISGTIGDLRFYTTNIREIVSARVIKSLKLRTNHGRKYGPFGRSDDNDTPFNYSTGNGSAIVGFHGRCGILLDSIGVYVGPTSFILTGLIRNFGVNTLYRWLLMGSKLKWTFVLLNLSLEILSAYFDQISSPTNPRYALVAMIVSFVALVICLVEFGIKVICNLLRQNNGLTYQSLIKDKPLESFLDNFGFLCTIMQCVTSSVQYAYFKRHQENPLKLSFFPLLLAIYVICTRFM